LMSQEKSMYLITALQGWATDVLYWIPKDVTDKETFQALEDRFGDQHFDTIYRSQQKTWTQKVEESLQDFATATEQLAHCAYPTLHEDHIRKEAGKAFTDRAEDSDIKIQLLLGGEKTVSEALWQALELQAVLLAARPHKTNNGAFWGSWSTPSPPNQEKECKAIRMLELWRARPFPGQLPLWTGGSKWPVPATWRKASKGHTGTVKKASMVTK
jgi:hypothetical protein